MEMCWARIMSLNVATAGHAPVCGLCVGCGFGVCVGCGGVFFGVDVAVAVATAVAVFVAAAASVGVLVGIVCHFSVMPLVGWGLTKVFAFPPEIAAGIILIGSCSSGLASNVMAYLARSNLVLSVTVTAITTLVAPLLRGPVSTRN